MKNEILKKFEGFYNNEKPQVPQYINYLLRNLEDPDLLNEVLGRFPICKKSTCFWNNRFWSKGLVSFLKLLSTQNYVSILEYYFRQKSCYNIQLLQYAFENNPDKTIETLCVNNALNEPTHLRGLIYAGQFEFVFLKLPKETIQALRTTELFLETKIWEKIERTLQSVTGKLFDYYLTLKDLRETNQSYEKQLEKYSELFNDPVKLFFHLSLSHERNIFLNQNNEVVSTDFNVAINAIYNFVSDRCNCGNINYDLNELSALQRRIFINVKEQEEYNGLFVLLFKFLEFKSNVFEFFCFDKNAKPIRDRKGNLILKPQDENKELLWVKNGNKYEYWNSYFILKGRDLTFELVNSNPNHRATCNSEEQFIDQANLLTAQYRNKLVYEDLNLSGYKLKDSIPLCHVVNTLEAFRENTITKELSWKEHCMSESEDFEHYCSKLKGLNLDNCFVRIEKYTDLEKMCMSLTKLDQLGASTILDFHTTNLQSDKSKQLDLKPIIRIGEVCIMLPWFMQLINAHIVTLNNLIQNVNLKETFGKLVEEKVVNEFGDSFGTNSTKSLNHVNKKGDYDCLAYKDGVLFVIQVKSTHIRASLKDNYLFTEREIAKAKYQIDKNLLDLNENFRVIRDELKIKEASIDQLQIFPLIVTTSFEKDGETFISSFDPKYKIHKISLFELQILLRGEEQNLFDYNSVLFSNNIAMYTLGKRRNSAREIIEIIENNRVWAKINSSPISINKKYYTISNSTGEQLCDESIREYGKGNDDCALILISEAIKQNPSNPKFYCHLGDINSDLGQLEEAKKCYVKSIQLDSEFIDAYYNLSQVHLKQKALLPAYVCLTIVLELDPNDNDARKNIDAIKLDFENNLI
ncbi:tetratricopeptide repeat protein [Ancylomarina longa]|nr:tetratricopeptide repeat protein [Ancylomarina longa]